MEDILKNLKSRAFAKKKENKKLLKSLRKTKSKDCDSLFYNTHNEVFQKIDCKKCANCCITTGPLLKERDIQRLSKYFKMKPSIFTTEYLRIDEDDDWVFKLMPCPFLDDNKLCSVYDVRPKACREYPHTDSRNMKKYFKVTLKNTEICPGVFEILEKIKSIL